MTKKQKIKDQIKSLRDLIADLELSLLEEEDVGKTDETDKKKNGKISDNEKVDFDELMRQIEKLKRGGGPGPVPYIPDRSGYQCYMCGTWVYGNYHTCAGKWPNTPRNDGGWTCQCGTRVGMMQVHNCGLNPGPTYITYG